MSPLPLSVGLSNIGYVNSIAARNLLSNGATHCNSAMSHLRSTTQGCVTHFLINNDVDVDLVLQAVDEFAPIRAKYHGLEECVGNDDLSLYTTICGYENTAVKYGKGEHQNMVKDVLEYLDFEGVGPETLKLIAQELGPGRDNDPFSFWHVGQRNDLTGRSVNEEVIPTFESNSQSEPNRNMMLPPRLAPDAAESFVEIDPNTTVASYPVVVSTMYQDFQNFFLLRWPIFLLLGIFAMFELLVQLVRAAWDITDRNDRTNAQQDTNLESVTRDSRYGTMSGSVSEETTLTEESRELRGDNLEEDCVVAHYFGVLDEQ